MTKKKTIIVLLLISATILGVMTARRPDTRLHRTLQGLDDENWQVRREAVKTLGKLEPHKNVILPLAQALGDENQDVRDAAIAALADIGPEAIPALVRALEDNAQSCGASAEALAEIGP